MSKHGHRGRSYTSPTYNSWTAMKKRCYYAKHPYYHLYGGRGVCVCAPWRESFEEFLKGLGERPKGMTLDRINGDGNYEPGNVRWATQKTQIRHSRLAKLNPKIAQDIKQKSQAGVSGKSLAALYGVQPSTISKIIRGQRWAA